MGKRKKRRVHYRELGSCDYPIPQTVLIPSPLVHVIIETAKALVADWQMNGTKTKDRERTGLGIPSSPRRSTALRQAK